MDDLPIPRWLAFVAIVVFAFLGGVVGYTTKENERGQSVIWRRAFMEGVGSGFVGVLVLLVSLEMGISLLLAGFLAGVFGYLGVMASIGVFNRFISSKTGFEMPKDKETDK